jgi:hypothetical protein
MKNMSPQPISPEEWQQIIAVPAVREAWGLEDDITPKDFSSSVSAAKFDFVSGSPGYVGDLYILQGDALTGYSPMVLRRADDGTLAVVRNEEHVSG